MAADTKLKLVLTADATQFAAGMQRGVSEFTAAVQKMRDAAKSGGGAVEQAFAALGARSIRQIRAEIVDVNAALLHLKNAGAGPEELARAARLAQLRVAELRGEIGGLSNSSNAGTSALATAGHRMAAMAASAIAAQKAVALLKDAFQTGIDRQALQTQFTFSFGGDAQRGARELQFVKGVANDLGLALEGTAKSYAKLAASAKGTALEGRQTRDIFTAVAQAAAVMGLSADESEGALLAISQMMSKGTVSAEELRGQLGERLPGAFNIAAKAMGVTTAQLGKMLEQGQVLSTDFLPKFAAALSASVADALPGAQDSVRAQLQRLLNQFDEFKARLAESGLLDAVSKQIDKLLKKLGEMAASGELQRVADSIAKTAAAIIEFLGNATLAAVKFREEIALLVEGLLALRLGSAVASVTGLAGAFTAAGAAAGGAAGGVTAFGLALRAIPLIAVGTAAAFLISKLVELAAWFKRGDAAAREYSKAVDEIAHKRAQLAGEPIKNDDELAAMTREELELYRERIAGAEEYNRARAASLSVNPEIRAKFAEARQLYIDQANVYDGAIGRIDAALKQETANEKTAANNILAVKRGLLSELKANYAAQLKATEEAVAKLNAAQSQRKQVQADDKKTLAELGAPGQGSGTPNLVDAAVQSSAARAALAKGDFEKAIALAGSGLDLLKKMKEAGSETSEVLQGTAKELIKIRDEASKGQEVKTDAGAVEAQGNLEKIKAQVEELKNAVITPKFATDPDNLQGMRDELEKVIAATPIPVTVTLNKLELQAEKDLGSLPAKADGGPIVGPGGPTEDRVLMWGSNGEFVHRAAAVRYYGREFMQSINAMRLPRFANGGLVERVRKAAPAAAGGGTTINLTLPGLGTFPVQAADGVAQDLIRAARMRGRRS